MLQCYIDNRNVGLKHLQPSAKDLEHGLELHKNSLVWDAYGFSPNGPVDGALADDLIDKGVYPEDFTDAMERYRQTEFLRNPNYQKVYAELWEYAGVNCIFQNSGVEGNRPDLMIKRFSNYLNLFSYIILYIPYSHVQDKIYDFQDILFLNEQGHNLYIYLVLLQLIFHHLILY